MSEKLWRTEVDLSVCGWMIPSEPKLLAAELLRRATWEGCPVASVMIACANALDAGATADDIGEYLEQRRKGLVERILAGEFLPGAPSTIAGLEALKCFVGTCLRTDMWHSDLGEGYDCRWGCLNCRNPRMAGMRE
jgi:hypothetical protein